MTKLRIRRMLVAVWVIPCLLAAPNLHPAKSVSNSLFSRFGEFTRVTCFDGFSDAFRFYYFMTLFVLVYLIPLGLIAVTCFRIASELLKKLPSEAGGVTFELGRRKVAKMVLVVVFSFIVCWSPYFIVTAVSQIQTENFLHFGQYFFTMLLINLLAFAHSCVNPFIYFAMSARFRKGFLHLIHSFYNCSHKYARPPENIQLSILRNGRTVTRLASLPTSPFLLTSRRIANSERSARNFWRTV
ncbi:RYamide receptor [Folsomia candida]|uniref:RYamide receptor n=1 Tax=Folsomia candida TaxID=158441 RepID=UPI00160530CB|nr:RYamide receptor [Folsomia candida]